MLVQNSLELSILKIETTELVCWTHKEKSPKQLDVDFQWELKEQGEWHILERNQVFWDVFLDVVCDNVG